MNKHTKITYPCVSLTETTVDLTTRGTNPPTAEGYPVLPQARLQWLQCGRGKTTKFVDYIVKSIFLNENFRISTKISLQFIPKGLTNNVPASVQMMAQHRGDTISYEPMIS